MMKNLPQIRSQKFSSEEVALLQETYAKGLSPTETKLFLKQAESMNLNPFTKEIYGMKLGGRLVLMTSIEGRRKIAHATGVYLGCKVTITPATGKPFAATAVVKKLVKGHVAEFEATVLFDEFDKGEGNWKKMPRHMLSKVAESTALRMAFQEMDQIYDEAEAHAVKEIQDHIHMDTIPDYESQSQETDPDFEVQASDQEPEPVPSQRRPPNLAPPSDPGEFIVRFGSRKANPTPIKDMPRAEVEEFVNWAKGQERLAPNIKDYLVHAEAFLR